MMTPSRFVHYTINDAHDKEHWELFQLIDELIVLLKDKLPHEDAVLTLKSAMHDHFDEEIIYMRTLSFPYVESHILDHNRLLVKLDKFVDDSLRGSAYVHSIVSFEEVFISHIDHFDRQYANFIMATH